MVERDLSRILFRVLCLRPPPAGRFFYVMIRHVFHISVCLHSYVKVGSYRKAPLDEIISMRLKFEGMWD